MSHKIIVDMSLCTLVSECWLLLAVIIVVINWQCLWYGTAIMARAITIACLVHQSLASLAPTYLTTGIHLVSEYGRRPLRSSTDRALTVPRTHNRFGDKSFAVAGPRLWNSSPISLCQISSFGQFRRYLKNHCGIWEITAQCDVWFSALYKYSYLRTYLREFTWFIWWVQTQRQVAANPQTKLTNLGCVYASRLLPSTSLLPFIIIFSPLPLIIIFSARKLILQCTVKKVMS